MALQWRTAVKELGLQSSSDERQGGREAARGEGGVAFSSSEGLGSASEGTHELGVELIEHPAGCLCGRVDHRRGRTGKTVGAGLRILRQDRLDAEHARTGPPSHQGGLFLDLFHQGLDPLPVLLRRQVGPAEKGRQDYRLLDGEALVAGVFSTVPGRVLPGTVDPPNRRLAPFEGRAGGNCKQRGSARSPQKAFAVEDDESPAGMPD